MDGTADIDPESPPYPAIGACLMSVPVSTKTSRKPNLDLEDGIEYPSSDSKPMGETGTHARVALMNIYGVLDRYFMNNPRVAVNANMFIYYVQGDPKRNVCPDAFVAMGVPNEPDRRSYKVWKERKAPDVVLEVTSRKTRKQDLTKKFEIYRDVLRVREYFWAALRGRDVRLSRSREDTHGARGPARGPRRRRMVRRADRLCGRTVLADGRRAL
jgi:Putative restriction endonuclease